VLYRGWRRVAGRIARGASARAVATPGQFPWSRGM
jgi:hypothetical protein